MNATTLEVSTRPAVARSTSDPSPGRTRAPGAPAPRPAPGRTRRRPGRGTGPEARPARLAGPAVPLSQPGQRARSCRVATPPRVGAATGAPSCRLTDRGIALVLVTGLLIVTAALAVVGLTALRVTGDGYRAAGQAVLASS